MDNYRPSYIVAFTQYKAPDRYILDNSLSYTVQTVLITMLNLKLCTYRSAYEGAIYLTNEIEKKTIPF